MSWQDYFEIRNVTINYGKRVECYSNKDKSVTELPANLPMPPTDTCYCMFNVCLQLKDISALAKWDVSNVKNMCGMFYNCELLQDISALSNWKSTRIGAVHYMFYGCSKLQDIGLTNWKP